MNFFADLSDPQIIKMASYVGAGLCIGFGAIGAAVGQGYTGALASQAISMKVPLSREIVKNMLVGQAIAESAGIFALVVAIMLIFVSPPGETLLVAASLVGAGLCMGLGALGSGAGSGIPGGKACLGIANQPHLAGKLSTTMLIGSAVCQTPAIFSMVVALMLMFLNFDHLPFHPTWAALIGAGLCMGFGAIGSGAGSGFPAGHACEGITRQPLAAGKLTTTMLVGSAVCQTPAILSMVVALILIFVRFDNMPLVIAWGALIGAGASTGLAAIGSGVAGGLAAGSGCAGIARNPETIGPVTTTMLVGQAVSQTPSIFGLVVSFILLFVVRATPEAVTYSAAIACLAAGVCMGFGAIGSGAGNGLIAERAVLGVAKNAEATPALTRTMILAQAISQAKSVYALVIALVLLFGV